MTSILFVFLETEESCQKEIENHRNKTSNSEKQRIEKILKNEESFETSGNEHLESTQISLEAKKPLFPVSPIRPMNQSEVENYLKNPNAPLLELTNSIASTTTNDSKVSASSCSTSENGLFQKELDEIDIEKDPNFEPQENSGKFGNNSIYYNFRPVEHNFDRCFHQS